MSRASKLRALQKRCELAEQEVLAEKSGIDRIVEERTKIVEKVRHDRDTLTERFIKLSGGDRGRALRASNVGDAQSITGYLGRLRQEIQQLDQVITARQQELDHALHRAQLAETELQEAMLERRRVEKVIERVLVEEQVQEAGREESSADERTRVSRTGGSR